MPVVKQHPGGGEAVHYTHDEVKARQGEFLRKLAADDFTPMERAIMALVKSRPMSEGDQDAV